MYSLDTLFRIDFELTSHCNSKCPQCPRYDMKGHVRGDLDVKHLEFELIKRLPVDQMQSLKEVFFCGNFGDPLMHPQLDQIIEIFEKQHIGISTNASLRSKEWWKSLGERKNINVTFCIDGIGEVHELYRRNTSYAKIMQNAEHFIKAGGQADWQFIVFKHNEHQIEEAKDLANRMGFRKIFFMYSDRFDTEDKWQVYDEGKYLYDLETASEQITLRKHLNVDDGDKWWKEMYRNKKEITCVWSKQKKLYIHSDGLVYPCCMLGSMEAGKSIEQMLFKKIIKDFARIDLHHHSLGEILLSEAYTKALPDSMNEEPFQHPVCIENCNCATGKIALSKKTRTWGQKDQISLGNVEEI